MSINRQIMSAKQAALFSSQERVFAEAIARVNAANPFLPERIVAEREALAGDFVEAGADWNTRPPSSDSHVNVRLITERCGALLARVQKESAAGTKVSREELALYEEVAAYWLYQTYSTRFDRVILAALDGRGEGGRVEFFPAFRADVRGAADRWRKQKPRASSDSRSRKQGGGETGRFRDEDFWGGFTGRLDATGQVVARPRQSAPGSPFFVRSPNEKCVSCSPSPSPRLPVESISSAR